MFWCWQVLDDEGEEDDDNEKDANQGSFAVSSFRTRLCWLSFVRAGEIGDLGVFTARPWIVLMTKSQSGFSISMTAITCGIVWLADSDKTDYFSSVVTTIV